MQESTKHKRVLVTYHVWDRTVRIFHWINLICIVALISVGLIILYGKSFGISSDGKILLKTIHTYFGYVFVLNLCWRIIWGFLGSKYARWAAILPFGRGYKAALGSYLKGVRENRPPSYLGHNPLARLMVTLLLLLLITQATTGLILAGTDLYLPPFGHEIAEWVTASGEDHTKLADLKPGSKEHVDPQSYKEMRAFRTPFITVHKYGFYILILAIILHIVGVVITELKERNGIVSAMFTGDKVFSETPVDLDRDKSE
ncbi:MAG: cytochrome b/b6 domain-containing protein [Gammaproteobacteria bacterium]|nr:MAG: cytochrome b/b6 domain-containing protein [Gammaproteobacteria bacterium]RLA47265.1 MAG: cytochrome b/b6 domain-containing protein [Gammaproteobacteria bacterium]